jgi:acetyltransferase EpsM
MSRLLLWGAGGHGKVVLEVATAMNRYSAIAFIDDQWDGTRTENGGGELLGTPSELHRLRDLGYVSIVISIGSNRLRARCYRMARQQGWDAAILVHPTAIISPSARLGAGTVVMPRVVVNAGAEVGENCILNTAAVVEHDCRIGDHAHLSPGVVLGGGVTVGSLAHLGLGSVALPGAVIGEGATVGAAAVVLHAVPPGITVAGVPARPLEKTVKTVLRLDDQIHDHTSLVS